MTTYHKLKKKGIGVMAILLLTQQIILSQTAPVSQVEGFLEVFVPGPEFATENIFLGLSAGQKLDLSVSSANSFFGNYAGTRIQEGRTNTIVGSSAGLQLREGNGNCFFGMETARNMLSESNNNSFFGTAAGQNINSGDGNIAIGYSSGPGAGSPSFSNKLYIHNNKGAPLIYGDFAGRKIQIGSDEDVSENATLTIDKNEEEDRWQLLLENRDGFSANWYVGVKDGARISSSIFAPSKFVINTNSDYETGKFYILANNGNVGIGEQDPTEKLHVNGNILADNVSLSSDIRFKKEIKNLKKPLQVIKKLRGISHLWKQEAFPYKDLGTGTEYGFIAQELEKVLPELVSTDADGYKSVNYLKVIPILVEAIKEMEEEKDKEIDQQKTTNEQLLLDLEQLKKQVDQQNRKITLLLSKL